MTLTSTPATKARRRKIVAVCTCPHCFGITGSAHDGVFYCSAGREHVAYADGQFIAASANPLEVEFALNTFRAEAIELAAAAADLAHDVAQASTDADVVAALTDDHTCSWIVCPVCVSESVCTDLDCAGSICRTCRRQYAETYTLDAEIHRLNAAMPQLPPPTYYDRHAHGFIYEGCSETHPTMRAAVLARDGRL